MGRIGVKPIQNVQGISHIILEEVNFIWFDSQLKKVKKLWNGGESIESIAEAVNRTDLEVLLCIMDMYMKGQVRDRIVPMFRKAN